MKVLRLCEINFRSGKSLRLIFKELEWKFDENLQIISIEAYQPKPSTILKIIEEDSQIRSWIEEKGACAGTLSYLHPPSIESVLVIDEYEIDDEKLLEDE